MTPDRTVTVAVDASWLRDGGIARMAQEIVARKPSHVRVVEIRNGRRNAGALTPIDLAIAARRADADVIWSPGFMPPALPVPGKRLCITIHDLAHLHHYSAAHRLYYNGLIRRLLSHVDVVFTVSDYTRAEILRWAPGAGGRVRRIYNGVSDAFHADPSGAEGDGNYVLYVGNRRGYKNIVRMIAGFARSGLAGEGLELWLTGERDEASSQCAAREGVADRVKYLGRVPDAELASLYRGARALAFVSRYEGFGLPVVEAMASGCPVLTSNTTALAEVAGDAAMTVDPMSVPAIAQGLRRICLDAPLRRRLRTAGLVRSASFSWDRCASEYWQALVEPC